MRQSSVDFGKFNIQFEAGDVQVLNHMQDIPAKESFDNTVIEYLNAVSRVLMTESRTKAFPDIVTLAFFMRKASVINMKKRFAGEEDADFIRLGRGTIFHIAPSNVPVNYAYSLISGLLCGNKNVVRIPSKDFEQVSIINKALNEVLDEMPDMKQYICLIRYGHDQDINDALSSIADVRVVWGGDNTINEFRKSPMHARAAEVTFADRYSIALIDSDVYMKTEDKAQIANDFYNDTYLTDQNACTSPRVVIWTGSKRNEAKDIFWSMLYDLVKKKYELSAVQAVNKLTSGYMLAASMDNANKISSDDNLIVRMSVGSLTADMMDLKDNSGYFFEYDCNDIMEIKDICDDLKCQTVSYIGDSDFIKPLIMSGVRGVDRIVPVGRTMDFDLYWDGYNLFDRFTRIITIQ